MLLCCSIYAFMHHETLLALLYKSSNERLNKWRSRVEFIVH